MLYIHTLADFNIKTLEIESVPLVRELKQNKDPFSIEHASKQFSRYFVSKTDIDSMQNALESIPSVVTEIVEISKTNANYERVNLQRACASLNELTTPLLKNIEFAKEMFVWQDTILNEISSLLTIVSTTKDKTEKMKYSAEIMKIFAKLLRTNQLAFHYTDVINEAQVSRITGLVNSMSEGFFIHVNFQQHLQKPDTKTIMQKISDTELQKMTEITSKIADIKKGIERAYESNMRLVTLAVILYANVKIA